MAMWRLILLEHTLLLIRMGKFRGDIINGNRRNWTGDDHGDIDGDFKNGNNDYDM